MTLESRIAEVVRQAVEEALPDGLSGPQRPEEPEEGWKARVWSVPAETRLSLADVAEALDCSERQARRFVNGETRHPRLPSVGSVGGVVVKAGELRRWIEDVEQANQFRESA